MARRNRDGRRDDAWMDGPSPDDPSWLAGSSFVPATGNEVAHLRPRWRRTWWVAAIWVAVVAFPVLSLMNLWLLARPTPAPPPVVGAYESGSRAAATQALHDWLASDPAPLPGALVLGWERVRTVPGQTEAPGKEAMPSVDVHTFSVAVGRARFWVDVSVGVDPQAGMRVVGSPALSPVAGHEVEISEQHLWPGWYTFAASQEVEVAVQTWAKAYFSGSGDVLRQAVGDPDRNHQYTPLSGVQVVSTKVTRLAVAAGKNGMKPKEVGPVAIANVSVSWTWGQPSGQPGTQEASTTQVDVRIEQANTATPRVVAWGATGTGPQLKAFQNAFTGPPVVVVTPDVPTVSPSGSPTPADPGASPSQQSPSPEQPSPEQPSPEQPSPEQSPSAAPSPITGQSPTPSSQPSVSASR